MKKYFKILIVALAVAVIVPQVAMAAWWNPSTWGWLNRIFHFQQTTQKQEQVIKQDDKKDETAGWKTYTNTQYGFEIKYPSGWFYKQYSWGPKLSGASGKGIAFCPADKYNEQNCAVEPMMNTPVAPIFINTSIDPIISSSLSLSEDGQIYKDIYNKMFSTFKFTK